MHYQILTNTSCNLACKYCFEEHKDILYINDKEIANIVSFINKDMLLHVGDNISINISGGECLLNFTNLKKLVEKLNNCYADIMWEVSSNATLLTPEKIEYFNIHNFDYFLSLDGIQSSHDLNRKMLDGNGSYDKAFENISNVYETLKNHKKLIINSVITPNNVRYIPENYIFLCTNFNLSTVSMNIAYNQKWTTSDLSILKDKIHEIGSIYADKIINSKCIGFDFFDKQIKRNILNSISTGPLCSAGKKTITILPTGQLISCGDFSGLNCSEIEIGNVTSGVDVNKVNSFLSKCSLELFFSCCNGCAFINKCANYCPSRNYYSHGKLFEISDIECSISKILIEEADNIINAISVLGEDSVLKLFFEL